MNDVARSFMIDRQRKQLVHFGIAEIKPGTATAQRDIDS